jgi:hypothetical protein
MSKFISLIKTHWREILVLILFLNLHSGINQAAENSGRAYDYAADAAMYAENASNYAADASDYASQAADSASYCEYL